MRLSDEQMDRLRTIGHGLRPSVEIGAGGITDFVLRQIDAALASDEIVKVRVPYGDRSRRTQVIDQLAPRTRATLVNRDNNAAVLYRPADNAVIDLPPAARRAG